MRWKVLGLVVFALIVAVFTLINTTQVTVDFLFVKTQMNLVLVILLAILLGMILMAILWSLRAWQLRGERNALRREIAELEERLKSIEETQVSEVEAVDGTVDDGDGSADNESRPDESAPVAGTTETEEEESGPRT